MIFKSLKNKAESFLDQYKKENPATFAAAEQAIGGLLILDGFVGIDNPLGGKKRPGILGSLAGVIVGVLFLFIPTFIGNLSGVNKMTATTNATIVSVSQQPTTTTSSNGTQQSSTTCSAVAKYTVNGKEYSQAASITSNDMCSFVAGQTKQINYNPDNPGQWSTDVKTIGLFMKIFFVAGILAIITSLFTFTIRLLSIIFGWKLLKNGRALAKTLPDGNNLGSLIKQIEHEFKTTVFSAGATGVGIPQVQTQPAPNTQTPPQPAPQNTNVTPENKQLLS